LRGDKDYPSLPHVAEPLGALLDRRFVIRFQYPVEGRISTACLALMKWAFGPGLLELDDDRAQMAGIENLVMTAIPFVEADFSGGVVGFLAFSIDGH